MKLEDKSQYLRKQRFHFDFLGQCQDFSVWQDVINNYHLWNARKSNKVVIPRKIHQIWISGKLPREYRELSKSWTTIMPDYEYKLWDESEIQKISSPLQDLFNKAKNPGVKSDIGRYMILKSEGGMYVDTDFEAVRNIEPCLSGSEFICGQAPANPKGTIEYLNGLIASIPNHPIINIVVEKLGAISQIDEQDAMTIINSTGPTLLTDAVNSIERTSAVGCLPSNYFYPWPAFMKECSDIPSQFYTECTYAVHHWGCSWFKWIDYEKLGTLGKLKFKIKNSINQFKKVPK